MNQSINQLINQSINQCWCPMLTSHFVPRIGTFRSSSLSFFIGFLSCFFLMTEVSGNFRSTLTSSHQVNSRRGTGSGSHLTYGSRGGILYTGAHGAEISIHMSALVDV